MGDREKQLEVFYNFLTSNFNKVKAKYKQFCFLNHIDFNEDTLQDTILKIAEKIKKDGLKAQTEYEIECYLFQSFKFNTFQTHLQEGKRLIDDNIDYQTLELIDDDYNEDREQFIDFIKKVLEKEIQKEFDTISFCIWRLRYLVTINGETLNYKQIKEITGIRNTRSRIVKVNQFVRDNYSLEELKKCIIILKFIKNTC